MHGRLRCPGVYGSWVPIRAYTGWCVTRARAPTYAHTHARTHACVSDSRTHGGGRREVIMRDRRYGADINCAHRVRRRRRIRARARARGPPRYRLTPILRRDTRDIRYRNRGRERERSLTPSSSRSSSERARRRGRKRSARARASRKSRVMVAQLYRIGASGGDTVLIIIIIVVSTLVLRYNIQGTDGISIIFLDCRVMIPSRTKSRS